ncbi:hypothetical protein [Pseudomonas sp. 2hn]|uniref:hypothetical protein n=1 Tax=Pseudomonas sp. 2hn TaxID=2866626 RepID=UPI001C7DDFBC|nr:hypothetical protein [Pseudomonas sp. 2hn]QZA57162.1 hypothetical protein K2O50_16295 [Pseudomonas sp. 2hn]
MVSILKTPSQGEKSRFDEVYMSFIDDCLAGYAFLDEIDDFVDEWHDGTAGVGQELYQYLGMTRDEYGFWMTTPSVLPYIISARRNRRSLQEEIDCDSTRLAARASSKEEVKKLEAWLRKIGKL